MKKSTTAYSLLFIIFISLTVGLFGFAKHLTIFYTVKYVLFTGAMVLLLMLSVKNQITDSISTFFLSVFVLTVFVSTVTAEIVNYEGILLSVLYVLLLFVAIFVPSEQFKIKSNIIKSFKYVLSIAVLLSLPLLFTSNGYAGGRYTGLFLNANSMGACSAILATIIITTPANEKSKFETFVLFSALISLIFTQSRTSCLSLIITICLYFFIKRCYKQIFYLLISVSLSLFIVFVLLYDVGDFSVRDIFEQTGRELYINTYIDKFLEAPLIGCGLSNDGLIGRLKTELAYFDILTFSGLIGFLSLLIVLCRSVCWGIKNSQSNNRYDIYIYPVICILTMSIGEGFLSNVGNPLSIFIWFWFCVYLKA